MILTHIVIGEKAKAPLRYVQLVRAVKNKGLEGDRYFYGQGTFNKPQLSQIVREVSILPYESLGECNSRLDTHLDFLDLRRNLIIKDFDASLLKGKVFTIGTSQLRIVRTSPPCRYLSRLLGVDMMTGLKYLGGYRAVIVQSGVMVVGDEVKYV